MKSATRQQTPRASILEHFGDLPDPRREHTRLHSLTDIMVIAICGMIAGADNWVAIADYARAKNDWLSGFLDLSNGLPSHDTFSRVFSLISPEAFRERFLSWTQSVTQKLGGQVVPIDGKTLRRSHDRSSARTAIHMVSAWAADSRVVLGQVKTHEKSNEITAIPELLELLELEGCIVTIDAMGCQKDIAEAIVESGADYVLALKGNQKKLHESVVEFFEDVGSEDWAGPDVDYHETHDAKRGRNEIRRHWTVDDLDWLEPRSEWKGIASVGMVESERTLDGKMSIEYRYYISSLDSSAERFAHTVRAHWGIENSLHWVLDVAFREDDSRVRKGNGAENLALLRHIALNALRQDKISKTGVKTKRLRAGWDNDYLAKLLCSLTL